MNSVFDSKPTRIGPSIGSEKIHEFFARQGRPEVVPIRDWIERWYNQLPADKQADIRGRLRSSLHEFTTAYFELQMFAMLKNLGYEVTVEPTLADGCYRPDFLAQRDGESFFLEATVCGQGAGDLQASRNEQDAVEKLRSELQRLSVDMHSNLWLDSQGNLTRTLSAKKIAKPFVHLLRRTNAAEVQKSYEAGLDRHQRRPEYHEEVRDGDWVLTGVLEPKLDQQANGHVWGPARTAVGDATEAIRTTLHRKTRDWKQKGTPNEVFLIAMSVCHSKYFWNDGDENRAILQNPIDSHPTAPWREEFMPISAILFAEQVWLGNERTTRVKLYPNPGRALPASLEPLKHEHRLAKLTAFEP